MELNEKRNEMIKEMEWNEKGNGMRKGMLIYFPYQKNVHSFRI